MAQRSENTYNFTIDSPDKHSIHSFPFYIGIIAVLILTGLFGIVYFIDSILPTPLTVNDEVRYPNDFITERATWDLKNLTEIGPRVVGSYENEFITVNYLTRRINSIIQDAHINQQIDFDIQVVSGAYSSEYRGGVINHYERVQNVIVKVYAQNESNSSLLVNSHFDSVPTSPGGSDDGINVAVMLEILRLFSKSSDRPLHNIIFLFNGAEETPLEASHGFITQHKWAKECKILINLEATGAGGKIILFQTGPQTPWLIKYYSRVPHPYGQVAGEEIFQSGIIPSDTDFRIFRDYGGLVGLDMAFFKDGYRYHTKHDGFSNIPLGSYQHVGDNTLSLIKNLANAPEIVDSLPSEGKAVYFDIFGWFMFSYTNFVGLILNIVTIILSLATFLYATYNFNLGFRRSSLKYLIITLGAILGSWVISGLFIAILAIVLDLLGKPMSWYANSWLIYGLYIIPTIGLSGILLVFTNHENISLGIRCQIQAHFVRLIWTVVLTIGVCLNIRAMYALMVPIIFNFLAFFIIHVTKLDYSVQKWQILYASFLVIPSMILMYQAITTLSLFIPVTGRMGSDKNPELIVGYITFFLTLLVVSPLTCLVTSLRKVKYYFIILGTVFAVFFIIVFTPLGFPYDADENSPKPQRQWILHTSRKFFNQSGDLNKTDSGFFFLNLDRNSPGILKSYVEELSEAKSLQDDCDKYVGCGLPLSHPLMMGIVNYSTWIPTGQPILPEPLNLSVVAKENLAPTLLRYNVSITGPDRLTIYLVAKNNISVVNISLVENISPSATTRMFHNRPIYFILYQSGKGNMTCSFDITLQVPANWNGPALDLTVIGRYVHDKKIIKTPQFEKLLNQIPKWADVTAWLGGYHSYVL